LNKEGRTAENQKFSFGFTRDRRLLLLVTYRTNGVENKRVDQTMHLPHLWHNLEERSKDERNCWLGRSFIGWYNGSYKCYL